MTIKTATIVAAVGVAIGLVMALAAPFAMPLFLPELHTYEQAARVSTFYRMAEIAFAGGGILFFLVVLITKQKGPS